jgi:hypothetical protein
MHVAERSLFLGMSRMLWGFNFTPSIRNGKPVPINPDQLTQGFVAMPDTFECTITPRSAERARLIREDWQKAQDDYIDPSTAQLKPGVTLEKMSFE